MVDLGDLPPAIQDRIVGRRDGQERLTFKAQRPNLYLLATINTCDGNFRIR